MRAVLWSDTHEEASHRYGVALRSAALHLRWGHARGLKGPSRPSPKGGDTSDTGYRSRLGPPHPSLESSSRAFPHPPLESSYLRLRRPSSFDESVSPLWLLPGPLWPVVSLLCAQGLNWLCFWDRLAPAMMPRGATVNPPPLTRHLPGGRSRDLAVGSFIAGPNCYVRRSANAIGANFPYAHKF